MKREIEAIFQEIKDTYITESEVCMAELLADLTIPAGVSFEDAFELYVALMKWSDGDEFYVVKEDERIEL